MLNWAGIDKTVAAQGATTEAHLQSIRDAAGVQKEQVDRIVKGNAALKDAVTRTNTLFELLANTVLDEKAQGDFWGKVKDYDSGVPVVVRTYDAGASHRA